MNRYFFPLALVALTCVVSGCEDKKPSAAPGATATATAAATAASTGAAPAGSVAKGKASCFLSDRGMCTEYTQADLADEKKECEKEQGKWSADACPNKDLVGTCTNAIAEGVKIMLYKPTYASADEAKKVLCSDEGDKFVAAP